MTITTVQWNIGGGRILRQGEDPSLLASYSENGMDSIIQFLKETKADIITLQEVHRDSIRNQSEEIASKIGLGYVVSDFYAESHMEKGQELGQAIISRFPISDHRFNLFINPKYQVMWEDGSIATSHDKGATQVTVEINGQPLKIATAHLLPFRRFKVELESVDAQKVLVDVQNKLLTEGTTIIQGDFNLNFESLESILPELFSAGIHEIRQTSPTTPEDRKYDHVLYRGVEYIKSYTDNTVLTDHYPVVSMFEI